MYLLNKKIKKEIDKKIEKNKTFRYKKLCAFLYLILEEITQRYKNGLNWLEMPKIGDMNQFLKNN